MTLLALAPARFAMFAVVATFALTAAPAEAEVLGRVPDDRRLVAGPVFAGGGAVWVERDAAGTLYLGRSASGTALRIAEAPGGGLEHDVVDMAASARRVALVRRVVRPHPPSGPCDEGCPSDPEMPPAPVVDEVWSGRPGGATLRRVARRTARSMCQEALGFRQVEVAGETVVVSEAEPGGLFCEKAVRRRISGRVIALTASRRPITLATMGGEREPERLAAAGRWVAWQTTLGTGQGVRVLDRRRRRVVYRVASRRFSAGSFDLDATGRIVLAGERSSTYPCGTTEPPRPTYRLAVASPSRPAPRLLAARAHADLVAIADRRLVTVESASACDAPAGLLMRSLAGGPERRFTLSCGWRFATFDRPEFDGRRLLTVTRAPECSQTQETGRSIEATTPR